MGITAQGHADVLLLVPEYNTQSWNVLAIFFINKMIGTLFEDWLNPE